MVRCTTRALWIQEILPGMPIPQAASAMAELRCLKTAPLLGPAPRRSALRENRRLARAEAVEAAVSATRLHIRRRHACRYKENPRLTGARNSHDIGIDAVASIQLSFYDLPIDQ